MPRRVGALCAVVGSVATLLGACSPPDVSVVGTAADGTAVIANCGRYIEGIVAEDADSGRVVWEAQVSVTHPDRWELTIGEVRLGELPQGWIERAPYAPEPAPERWRFHVASYDSTDLTIADDLLGPVDEELDGRCGWEGVELGSDSIVPIVIFLVVPFGYAIVVETRRRRRVSAAKREAGAP